MLKNWPSNAGDAGSISGSGRSPEEENGHPLQYSCLGNPVDRGTWRATVHGLSESYTTDVTKQQDPFLELIQILLCFTHHSWKLEQFRRSEYPLLTEMKI